LSQKSILIRKNATKCLSRRKGLTVLPANVTTAPSFNLERSMLPADGAAIFDRTIFVQEATADEI
jgi:hypothetical protein